MFFVILALLEAGDEAIYPNPGFPIYESMINFTGATAVPSPIREKFKRFALDVDELATLITPTRPSCSSSTVPATRPAVCSTEGESKRLPNWPSSTI